MIMHAKEAMHKL